MALKIWLLKLHITPHQYSCKAKKELFGDKIAVNLKPIIGFGVGIDMNSSPTSLLVGLLPSENFKRTEEN